MHSRQCKTKTATQQADRTGFVLYSQGPLLLSGAAKQVEIQIKFFNFFTLYQYESVYFLLNSIHFKYNTRKSDLENLYVKKIIFLQ